MKAYSEDLRKKIVEAVQRGMKKSEAAYLFGVSLSAVKRYARIVCEGKSLAPRKAPGSRPKMDERTRKLLEVDLKKRPAVKLAQRCEYLEKVAGVRVSESTVCRMIKRLGFSRKKEAGALASGTSS